jgi:GNAT superfamily N-acetyltransferase
MTLTTFTDLDVRRRSECRDVPAIAATVAAAFFDDPVTRWLLPDAQRRRQLVQPMFELYVAPYVRNGEAYLTADGVGAAVWLPPGGQLFAGEEEEAFGEALAELAGPDIDRFVQLAETFERHHPTEPIYYCQFLATRPGMQGRGIGSALLSDVLARAVQEAMPAYHEATTPRNRALYERHGYVTKGEFPLPDGPPLWPMWREPR